MAEAQLEAFRQETRAWLEENCPPGARGPGPISNGSTKIVIEDADTRDRAVQLADELQQLAHNYRRIMPQLENKALRDFVDTDLTLLDRKHLSGLKGPDADRLHRVVLEETDNLQYFYEIADMEALGAAVSAMKESEHIYVVGSRLSYTFAYYLGWSLTKIRQNVRILKVSDSTAIDWLTIPQEKLRTVTAGAVYHDGIGLQAVRERFSYFPPDVWLYLLLSCWTRLGQEEHLAPRAGYVGDEIGSAIIASRLVKSPDSSSC